MMMSVKELIEKLKKMPQDIEVVYLFPGYPTETNEDGFVENFLVGGIYHVRKANNLYNIEGDIPRVFLDPQ